MRGVWLYALIGFIAAFAIGFLSKLTDVQVDEKRFFFKNLKFASGLAYGILYAFAFSFGAEFANLFLGIAIAVLLAGKIDSKAHQFAIAGFLGALVFFGFPKTDVLLVLAFAFFALLDEFLNDFFDVNPSTSVFAKIAGQGLFLEAFAFALSVFTGVWVYFAAILAFDVGYKLSEKLSRHFALKSVGSFGTHLLLDLKDCPSTKLSSKKFVLSFLKEFPKQIGMKAISKPAVKEIKTRFDEGVSGFVLLAESHVSIHTFPKFHSAHIDVFSCKPFDSGKARMEIEKRFSARYSSEKVFERMGWPGWLNK